MYLDIFEFGLFYNMYCRSCILIIFQVYKGKNTAISVSVQRQDVSNFSPDSYLFYSLGTQVYWLVTWIAFWSTKTSMMTIQDKFVFRIHKANIHFHFPQCLFKERLLLSCYSYRTNMYTSVFHSPDQETHNQLHPKVYLCHYLQCTLILSS